MVKGKARKGSTTSEHGAEDYAAAIMRPRIDMCVADPHTTARTLVP